MAEGGKGSTNRGGGGDPNRFRVFKMDDENFNKICNEPTMKSRLLSAFTRGNHFGIEFSETETESDRSKLTTDPVYQDLMQLLTISTPPNEHDQKNYDRFLSRLDPRKSNDNDTRKNGRKAKKLASDLYQKIYNFCRQEKSYKGRAERERGKEAAKAEAAGGIPMVLSSSSGSSGIEQVSKKQKFGSSGASDPGPGDGDDMDVDPFDDFECPMVTEDQVDKFNSLIVDGKDEKGNDWINDRDVFLLLRASMQCDRHTTFDKLLTMLTDEAGCSILKLHEMLREKVKKLTGKVVEQFIWPPEKPKQQVEVIMTNTMYDNRDESQEMILDISDTCAKGSSQGTADAIQHLTDNLLPLSLDTAAGHPKHLSADPKQPKVEPKVGGKGRSEPWNTKPTFSLEMYNEQVTKRNEQERKRKRVEALKESLLSTPEVKKAPPPATVPAQGKPSVTRHTGSGLYKSGAPSSLASRPAGAGTSQPPFQPTVRATAPITNRPTIRQATPMPLFRAPASTLSVRSTAPSNFIRPSVPSTSRSTVQPITSASPGPSTPHQPAAPTPANQPAGGQAMGLTTNRPTAAETAISSDDFVGIMNRIDAVGPRITAAHTLFAKCFSAPPVAGQKWACMMKPWTQAKSGRGPPHCNKSQQFSATSIYMMINHITQMHNGNRCLICHASLQPAPGQGQHQKNTAHYFRGDCTSGLGRKVYNTTCLAHLADLKAVLERRFPTGGFASLPNFI